MDLKKYIYGHCVSPVSMPVWDSYSQSYQLRELPCGKCLHCRNTHVNEWCTRLYAQAKYSEHVYYITLDYAPFDLTSPVGRLLARDTAACYHNINSTASYGMHPLILEKRHLQNFFKRFRKNTSKKIQYFACGEYGTHAKGHGYGRPHFHAIIFSDVPISHAEFQQAWTLDGYKIGRVDYNDLVANGSFDEIKHKDNNFNANYVFKYVCKYLQKSNFDFEKLATIDFHRTYFKSMCETFIDSDTLFPRLVPITDEDEIAERWREYISFYSPFVVCSKRPSIGLQYFADNCQRFTEKDYRLFGLSKEVSVFPSYYRRKAKEILCPFSSLGKDSLRPSSNSRLPHVVSLLRQICDFRTRVENLGAFCTDDWVVSHYRDSDCLSKYNNAFLPSGINKIDLHLFDIRSKSFYIFNGYDYSLWHKYNNLGYEYVNDIPIENVLSLITPFVDSLTEKYLRPISMERELRNKSFIDSLVAMYGDEDYFDKFKAEIDARYKVELAEMRKKDLISQNSKISL